MLYSPAMRVLLFAEYTAFGNVIRYQDAVSAVVTVFLP